MVACRADITESSCRGSLDSCMPSSCSRPLCARHTEGLLFSPHTGCPADHATDRPKSGSSDPITTNTCAPSRGRPTADLANTWPGIKSIIHQQRRRQLRCVCAGPLLTKQKPLASSRRPLKCTSISLMERVEGRRRTETMFAR